MDVSSKISEAVSMDTFGVVFAFKLGSSVRRVSLLTVFVILVGESGTGMLMCRFSELFMGMLRDGLLGMAVVSVGG